MAVTMMEVVTGLTDVEDLTMKRVATVATTSKGTTFSGLRLTYPAGGAVKLPNTGKFLTKSRRFSSNLDAIRAACSLWNRMMVIDLEDSFQQLQHQECLNTPLEGPFPTHLPAGQAPISACPLPPDHRMALRVFVCCSFSGSPVPCWHF
uniref:(northern house mosquito) hypothetical protein n=1 Tax=Culex pipiens TaxID=7175 RepID=A0A8D8K519_CULPI